MLETLITSKTRIRILVKFFINAANNGYLRGLAEEMHESTNAIRKELNNLSEAGYLDKEAEQNRVTYKANIKHPFFETLQKIVFQYIGLDSIIEMILARMGSVTQIVVLGDYAKGIDSGIIDVLIVGKELNEDYIDQLAIKIEQEIKRKVNFSVQNYDFSPQDVTIIGNRSLIIYENFENTNETIIIHE